MASAAVVAGNWLCVKIKDDVRGLACEIRLRILCLSEEAGDPEQAPRSSVLLDEI